MPTIVQRMTEIIDESLEMISDELAIRFILLMGSQATEKKGPMSDIDIAVYVNPELYASDNLNIQLTFGTLLSKRLKRDDIDIVVLNDATPSMRYSALKNGIILYMTDEGEYEDYLVRALAEYYDNSYFLDHQYEYAKETLRGDMK